MKNFLLFMKTSLTLVKVLFVLVCSSSILFAQDQVKNHYSSKGVVLFDKNKYELSGFESRTKTKVGLDVLKMIDEAYLDHPDLGLSTHPIHKDAIELVDKRDVYHSTYLMPDGKTIFSSSITPINYIDENGWYREIRYELDEKPILNDIFRAPNQSIPKSIDASTGKTTFETPLGNIAINQRSKVRFINGNDEIGSVFSLNTSQREIGKNGMFVSNAYPNIDMQVVFMGNGYVKTNYIIKEKSVVNTASEFMIFEDVITLPKGMRIDFDTEKGINTGVGNDWEGSLVIRNEKNEDVFHYMIPFIYDNHYTTAMMDAPLSTFSQASESYEEQGVESSSFMNSSYRVEKISETEYKISVVVKTEWLLSEERQYPVVVDPVTFTGATLTFTAGNFCARRVSGTMPVDNPGPTGVGCYSTTTVLPAGYMLVSQMPVRLYSGYKTRGCAASSTWMKFYGPCGYEPVAAGFFYFCNTNLTNVDCGAPAGGTSLNDILSRCTTTGGGEICAAATPPSCSDQTLTFRVCYQTRCFANAAGTCATTSTQFPAGTNASYVEAGIANFRVDIIGEKIAITLAGSPASGSNVCPNVSVPLTLTTKFGVPNALSTANCTDQMGGTYSWTATCTGGTLSATSGTTSTTGGFAAATTWNSGATPGTYTISVTVCNTNCPTPTATMCDTKTVTYTVGNAIAPTVSNVTLCAGNATPTVSNVQAGYTYTWYTASNGGGAIAGTGNSISVPQPGGALPITLNYSVRATSPCNSTYTNFSITWSNTLTPPTTSGATACVGQSATLTASCAACLWYTASAGGISFNSTGTYTVTPVVGPVTYYVAQDYGACGVSTRTPVSINTNALTVTTNPTSFNPLCSPSTAQFSASVTGNTDIGPSQVCNTGLNTVENTGGCTGPNCTSANSGQLTVTTPAGVTSPLTSTSIQEVCLSITGLAGSWCGEATRIFLTSPSGTTFTLYGGRAKNSRNDQGSVNLCFTPDAAAVIYAPTGGAAVNIPSGTYLADGGNISTAFVGETAAAGSTWTISVADVMTGGGTCGAGLYSVTNFCITFGVNSPPTYTWVGAPGSLSSTTISNPVYTPPIINYTGLYTVTVTDAIGCTGIATVGVSCLLLSVDLLSFYGEVGERDNYLFWNTASEKNTDYFELERSSNGKDFEKIGRIEAAENSLVLREYNFTDKNRLDGINYYRLKIVDMDAKYIYSDIVVLDKADKETSMDIIPNPANSYIDISFQLNFASQSVIKIFDVKGSLVESIEIDADKGLNSHKVNLENYAKGVYSVVLNNNGTISTKRFIKQ